MNLEPPFNLVTAYWSRIDLLGGICATRKFSAVGLVRRNRL